MKHLNVSVLNNPEQLKSLQAADGLVLLPIEEWNRLKPDGHIIVESSGKVVACCSVWKSSLPTLAGEQPAAIGHFQSTDTHSGQAALERACSYLQRSGMKRVVGPINANTWNKYRLVTYSNGRAPFFLEPTNPEHYVKAWKNVGFDTFAEYQSTIMAPQTEIDARLSKVQNRLKDAGVCIRNLNPNDFESELDRMHELSCESFRNNLLYTPIRKDDFVEIYRPFKEKLNTDAVWLAEHDGACVGYLFSVPDYNQLNEAAFVDTLIVKTLAISPQRLYAGLGLLLLHRCHQYAAAKGFRHLIHALMIPNNRMKHFGRESSECLRAYTLLSQNL